MEQNTDSLNSEMHYVTTKSLNVCVAQSPNVLIYIPPGEHIAAEQLADKDQVSVRWRGRRYLAAASELRRAAELELEQVS